MANSTVAALSAAAALDGTELLYGVQGGADRKLTSGAVAAAAAPKTHAASHAFGSTDVITITEAQVTNLVADLALKAPLASPTLTGTPAVPTAAAGTSTTQAASTAFVAAALAIGLVATAVKTTTYTAAAGEMVLADTSTATWSLTLPTSPADGTLVGIVDINAGAGTGFSAHPLTVLRGGGTGKIDNVTADASLTGGRLTLLKWVTALTNWVVLLPNSGAVIAGESFTQDFLGTVTAKTVTLCGYAPRPGTVRGAWVKIASGTSCVVAVQIGGVSVTGLSALSATTTGARTAATGAAAFAAGARITAVVSSPVGTPTDLELAVDWA